MFRWNRAVMREGTDARKGRLPERHRRGTVLTPTPTFGPSVGTLLVAVVIGFVGTLLQGKLQEFCGPIRRTRRCSRKMRSRQHYSGYRSVSSLHVCLSSLSLVSRLFYFACLSLCLSSHVCLSLLHVCLSSLHVGLSSLTHLSLSLSSFLRSLSFSPSLFISLPMTMTMITRPLSSLCRPVVLRVWCLVVLCGVVWCCVVWCGVVCELFQSQ